MNLELELKNIQEIELKIKELSQGVESESKKFDEEIKNIRSLAQNKINMVSKKKSEKLRRNTTAIKELEEKKNSIIGQITTSHIEGKISHEEFQKLTTILKPIQE